MFNRRLVRIKVLQALYAHMSAYATTEEEAADKADAIFSLGKDVANASAVSKTLLELDRSLQSFVDLEHAMLNLLLELRAASEKRIRLLKTRYLRSGNEPSHNFVRNRVLEQYALNNSLRAYGRQRNVGWSGADDFVWRLYTTLEKEPFFDTYQEQRAPSYNDDRAVVGEIFNWLQDVEIDQLADEPLEEPRALYAWALSSVQFYYTDLDSVLDDLLCVTNGMQEQQEANVEILPKEISRDLRSFAVTLLQKSIEQEEANLQTLVPFLRNWDPSRVAFMDLLVLLQGLTEALNYPEIPIPVTINEHIELARLFSTSSSPQFVNGVLDAVLRALDGEGVLVKRERKREDKSPKHVAR